MGVFVGFGFFAGAVYDIFRAVRICLGNKKWAYRVTDVLYLVVLGFLNFLFFLSFNEGEFRLFMILKKYKKTKKKSENKSKYPLKVNKCLLYNLFNRKQNSEKCGKGAEISANKEKP